MSDTKIDEEAAKPEWLLRHHWHFRLSVRIVDRRARLLERLPANAALRPTFGEVHIW